MSVRILVGDALATLRGLPAESVQCVVTSPPYYGLRDYGVDGQIGLERTPAEFIAALVAVFDEVRRVLHPSGLVFVNLGDSYAGSGKGPTGQNGIGDQRVRQGFIPGEGGNQNGARNRDGLGSVPGIPAKNLLLIPQRFAIAMQEAGWWVRSEIAWCKKSAMPESVRDRPTSAWEPIWMFAKAARYFFDQDAVRVSSARPGDGGAFGGAKGRAYTPEPGDPNYRNGSHQAGREFYSAPTANLRNFWLLGPAPSSLEHYASFPPEIPRRCILAATSEKGACPACGAPWARRVEREPGFQARRVHEGGLRGRRTGAATDSDYRGVGYARSTELGWQPSCQCPPADPVPQVVLDPFLGSGTTALVADRLGRDAIGIELSEAYAEMARRRIASDAPLWTDEPAVEQPAPAQLALLADVAG